MKKLLSGLLAGAAIVAAGAANGADMGTPYVKAPLPAPVFSWTGCYAGTQSGLGTAHQKWQDVDTPGDIDANGGGNTATTEMSGAMYGGQIGCDYQGGPWFMGGNWVVGVQGMMVIARPHRLVR
jgi:outer membrane immunogenic protein